MFDGNMGIIINIYIVSEVNVLINLVVGITLPLRCFVLKMMLNFITVVPINVSHSFKKNSFFVMDSPVGALKKF